MNWMNWWNASAHRMSIQELKSLAFDITEGRVFGTWNMSDAQLKNVPLVFMPVAFGGMPPGCAMHIYEYVDKAGPRSINGMPQFFSYRFITRDDWKVVVGMLQKLEAQRKAFMEEAAT